MLGVLGGGRELIRWQDNRFAYTQPLNNVTRFARQIEALCKKSGPQSALEARCIGFAGGKQVHLVIFGKMVDECILIVAQRDDILNMVYRYQPSYILRQPFP